MTYQENAKKSVRGNFSESVRFVQREQNGKAHMIRGRHGRHGVRCFCGKRWERDFAMVTAHDVPVCEVCYVSSAIYAEKL